MAQNSTLSSSEKTRIALEKHTAVFHPVVVGLDALAARTVRPDLVAPQTPHEQEFQATFGPRIAHALMSLRVPQDPTNPNASWAPFAALRKKLTQTVQERAHLNISNLSPRLEARTSTLMPVSGGQDDDGSTTRTRVAAFAERVHVLSTKTRPKKICCVGHDGKTHAYLVKGQDDLHLDQRIMQLLTMVNRLFAHDKTRRLRTRYYGVVPISPRAGLIQWVAGTLPLFQLYRRWQLSEGGHPAAKVEVPVAPPADPQDGPPDTPGHDALPGAVFYAALLPALKTKGIEIAAGRQQWPLEVLRGVFRALSSGAPRWLLEKEICASSTATVDWWARSCTFSRSLAVMSVVGYVIGLGDRHLDNILMDFGSGEVVHIDYTVCFDKGRKLKVPELVPFRLTQTFEAALGVTGVDGVFRTACECVLRVLRQNRELLLTLLEAFVYDPLVDWTADKADDIARRKMELRVSLSLFSTRIGELKSSMAQQLDEGALALSHIERRVFCMRPTLDEYVHLLKNYTSAEARRNPARSAAHDHQENFALATSKLAAELENNEGARGEQTQCNSKMQSLRDDFVTKRHQHEATLRALPHDAPTLEAFASTLNRGLKHKQPAVLSDGVELTMQDTTPSGQTPKMRSRCVAADGDAHACMCRGAEALGQASLLLNAHAKRLAELEIPLEESVHTEWAEFLSSARDDGHSCGPPPCAGKPLASTRESRQQVDELRAAIDALSSAQSKFVEMTGTFHRALGELKPLLNPGEATQTWEVAVARHLEALGRVLEHLNQAMRLTAGVLSFEASRKDRRGSDPELDAAEAVAREIVARHDAVTARLTQSDRNVQALQEETARASLHADAANSEAQALDCEVERLGSQVLAAQRQVWFEAVSLFPVASEVVARLSDPGSELEKTGATGEAASLRDAELSCVPMWQQVHGLVETLSRVTAADLADCETLGLRALPTLNRKALALGSLVRDVRRKHDKFASALEPFCRCVKQVLEAQEDIGADPSAADSAAVARASEVLFAQSRHDSSDWMADAQQLPKDWAAAHEQLLDLTATASRSSKLDAPETKGDDDEDEHQHGQTAELAQPIPSLAAASHAPHTSAHAQQQRNEHAVSVLRRVKAKLEGRVDVAPGRPADRDARVTVSRQVDWLIEQARSEDNLCRMFEGWAPWSVLVESFPVRLVSGCLSSSLLAGYDDSSNPPPTPTHVVNGNERSETGGVPAMYRGRGFGQKSCASRSVETPNVLLRVRPLDPLGAPSARSRNDGPLLGRDGHEARRRDRAARAQPLEDGSVRGGLGGLRGGDSITRGAMSFDDARESVRRSVRERAQKPRHERDRARGVFLLVLLLVAARAGIGDCLEEQAKVRARAAHEAARRTDRGRVPVVARDGAESGVRPRKEQRLGALARRLGFGHRRGRRAALVQQAKQRRGSTERLDAQHRAKCLGLAGALRSERQRVQR